MIVRFGLELDRLLPDRPQTRLGYVTCGPAGFMSVLETQLGLAVPEVSQAKRLVQYRSCLSRLDSPDRFYHASFKVDELSVAGTLLDWRDKWYMAGWDGTFMDDSEPRLRDMAEIEALAAKEVSPCVGQRLQDVLAALNKRKTQIKKVELADALSDFPHLWQQILSHFEVVDLNVDTRLPIAETNSDLGKLQKALLDLNRENGAKPKAIKLKGDGSVIVLTARSKEVSARLLAEHLRSKDQSSNVAILTGKSGVLFDEALESVDKARCGFEQSSNWRPVLQVLPLALSLLWEPMSPQLLLQFLSHPVGPRQFSNHRELEADPGRTPCTKSW